MKKKATFVHVDHFFGLKILFSKFTENKTDKKIVIVIEQGVLSI